MFWINNKKFESFSDAIIIHLTEQEIIINENKIKLGDLKNRSDFHSFSRFVFPLKLLSFNQRTIKDDYGGEHLYPITLNPFELYSATASNKITAGELAEQSFQNISVQIIFFPHTKTFKDALLIVNRPNSEYTPFKVTTEDQFGKIVDYNADKQIFLDEDQYYRQNRALTKMTLPKCELELLGPVSSSGVDIKFTYKDINGQSVDVDDFKIKIKCDSGYINKSEHVTTKDTAIFKFIPLGLNSGDKVNVQVGIGKFTDVASKQFVVD